MSRYRKVSMCMWGDARFRGLTPAPPNAQTLWFYLLTGEYTTTIPGVVKGGEAAIAESLGWTVPAFRKAFEEIYAKGMAKPDWAARLVFLPNGLKHNPPQSPSVVTAWAKAFEELPECSLKVEIYHAIKLCLEGLRVGRPAAFQAAFNAACPTACPAACPTACTATCDPSEAEAEAETEGGSGGESTQTTARTARSRVRSTTKDETEHWYDNVFLPKYPPHRQSSQRKTALKEAAKLTPEQRPLAIANLELWNRTSEWQRGVVPGPATFFQNRQHLTPPSTMVNGTGKAGIPDGHELLERLRREAVA